MNRNTNTRFATNPVSIDMPRSRFSRSHSVKTSFNIGDLVPFYCDEVLPGDTFSIKTSKVVRMQPLVAPIMDNVYLDFYYFFVPNRIVWEHWKEFMGENTSGPWYPQANYSVPQLEAPVNGWTEGTLADYFGIPTKVDNISVNALPFRAYAAICNEFFRDENLQDPLNIPLNDSTLTGVNTGDQINDIVKGGKPFIANKAYDLFTGSLPAPQKGPDVTISTLNQPVVGNGYSLGLNFGQNNYSALFNDTGGNIARLGASDGAVARLAQPDSSIAINEVAKTIVGVMTKEQATAAGNLAYTGLETIGESLITINQLRSAFQIQKFYEKQARGGSRYRETLKSMFGVVSPDARQQVPEYIGGNRIPININMVIQTSETGNTPLGETAAYSLTSDSHSDFTKSFTEHGFVIGVMVARYDHTYQQGIEKFWSRKTKFDYYWPLFANLGEQAILNKEIYAQGTSADDQVFGYQEAWADYRYKPNRVTGEMRSNATTPLDMWHLADDYASQPYLGADWIRENKNNLDRALAVTSSVSNQLIADIYIQNIATRCMPIYSIPGLIDHH